MRGDDLRPPDADEPGRTEVGLPPAIRRALEATGLLTSASGRPSVEEARRLRAAEVLVHDLGLDAAGVEVALRLLDVVAAQQAQLEALLAAASQRSR